jgi:hypothetical protein
MKRVVLALSLVAAGSVPAAAGDVAVRWSADGRSVVVANPGHIRVIDATTRSVVLDRDGVRMPRVIATSADDRVAVLDPVASEIAVLQGGEFERARVAETPVAALWRDDALFVLSRDGATLTRFRHAEREELALGTDPALMRDTPAGIAVYSQSTGEIALVDPSSMSIRRRAALPPAASDLESDGAHLYLTYPREGLVIAAALRDLVVVERLRVGAVPVDAAIEGNSGAMSGGLLSVADPSSKRVWRIERTQSPLAAFGRAFLRSLIGLRLIRPDSSVAPAGVDRVWVGGKSRYALDSSSGALFRIDGTTLRAIGSGVDAHAIDVSRDGRAAFWTGGELRIVR